MANRTRHKALREAVGEMLLSGQVIKPSELATRFEVTATDTAARSLWIHTYMARLIHTEARNMGLIALSCGPGQGFKAVQTAEDMELARTRAQAQLKGQATRGRRLLEKMRRLNQFEFPLEEVMTDVQSDAADEPAAVTSS